jgi:hypothetical protein
VFAQAAAATSPLAPVAPSCPRALALDVQAIGAEVSCLLSRYVQLDTSNPPGNERSGADFVAGYLAGEGIASQIIEAAPGRANVIARLEGKSRGQALLLVHHMDVVPATPSEWSVPPFSGRLDEGYVYGRGSLDNKGGGVVELVALALAKRLGIVPAHDLVLLGVADEESGGGLGARWLTEKRSELFADVSAVLNEGGAILQPGGGRVVYGVELAQKAPLWLRVTAQGARAMALRPIRARRRRGSSARSLGSPSTSFRSRCYPRSPPCFARAPRSCPSRSDRATGSCAPRCGTPRSSSSSRESPATRRWCTTRWRSPCSPRAPRRM